MVASIVSTGLAIGCIYALIGITYNVMFSASRVFSFTAGTLGMLGGVLGSLFIARLGMPVAVGFLLALAGGVVLGIVTEIVAVRPVLKSLDQHLYVLSTLALALMVQQFTAIEWGTEARPFPRRLRSAVLAADARLRGGDRRPRTALSPHPDRPRLSGHRRGHLCGARARAAGTQLAHGELCARRRHRRARRLCRRRNAFGLFRQWADADVLWFCPGGAGRHGQQPRRRGRRSPAGAVSANREFSGRRHLRLGRGLHRLHHRAVGAPRRPRRRRRTTPRLMDMPMTQVRPSRADTLGATSTLGVALPFLVLLVIGIAFPLFGGGYWGVIATRACVYWVLVSGLNLVVGFAGQIAIGWVALLTLGAYTTSELVAGNVTPELSPYLALAIAAAIGGAFGLIVGLPALRLRTFYFAITTLGFATIVTQVALAWQSVTGGGVGVAGPIFPKPFDSQWGFYYFCFGLAAICTWMTANI